MSYDPCEMPTSNRRRAAKLICFRPEKLAHITWRVRACGRVREQRSAKP